MRRSRFSILATAVTTALAPLALAACIFPSPSPGRNARLNAVASISASNAFAVGDFVDNTGQHELLEHWNGKSWHLVFLPPPIGKSLTSITAVNGHNVWAVSELRTLHFGGLGWSSYPNPAGVSMYKLASSSDSAVYGLGRESNRTTSLWLMTAGGWRRVSALATPAAAVGCVGAVYASDLAVTSAHDVWVVGHATQAASTNACSVVLHWDGTTWQSYADAPIAQSSLTAVSARTARDVWVVGVKAAYNPEVSAWFYWPSVLRWNGTAWTEVPTYIDGFLRDIEATPDGVWAVGMRLVGSGFPVGMVIQKWNGTSMANQPVQDLRIPGTNDNASDLTGVSVRDGVVTSVGSYQPRINVTATLTDRRNAN